MPVLCSIFHAAALGVRGFLFAMLLFLGYTIGFAFISIAVLKPIFPNNVGLWMHEGMSLGGEFPAPPGVTPLGGYWIVPICLFVGLLLLIATQRAARRWAARLRDRLRHRPAAAPEQH